jgi:hypothetical protein
MDRSYPPTDVRVVYCQECKLEILPDTGRYRLEDTDVSYHPSCYEDRRK